jgi:hypothetical protein
MSADKVMNASGKCANVGLWLIRRANVLWLHVPFSCKSGSGMKVEEIDGTVTFLSQDG